MHRKRKFFGGITAALMIASAFPATAASAEETKVNYETVLGDAYNYGIIADEYEQFVHTQTNFAVNKYTAQGQVIEANLSGEGNVPLIVNDFSDEVRFGGSTTAGKEMTYNVLTSKENESREDKIHSDGNNAKIKVTYKDNVAGIVNAYISKIKSASENLAKHNPSITITDDMINDMNHFTLDLTGYGDETVYVNVPRESAKFLNVLHTTDSLNILKNSETTVVFNVAEENTYIGKYHVTVNGVQINTETSVGESNHNKDVDNEIVQKVIWNFYNAKSVELNVTAGLFLVPQEGASVNVSGTSAGWIATAGKVKNSGGEWHFTFHGRTYTGDEEAPVPTPEPEPTPDEPEIKTGKLVITKTIAGDVTREEAEGALQFTVTNNETSETNIYTLHDFAYSNGKYTKELDLAEGGYTVEETVSDIDGYVLAYAGYSVNGGNPTEGKSTIVKINSDSLTTVDYADTYKNPTYEVSIGKVDINDSHELPGATLRITSGNETIFELVSGIEEHKVNLKAGDYTLTEITAPTGYEVAESMNFTVTPEGKVLVNGEEVSSVIMKDSPTPEPVKKTSVSVKKVFDDGDNQDKIRPLYVRVNLLADGKAIDSQKLDSSNSWAYTWANLDEMNGKSTIEYTVSEEPVGGYTAVISGDAKAGFTITNTHTPETMDITVSTSWDDLDNKDQLRPDEYDISLLEGDFPIADATLDIDNNFTHTFETLPIEDEKGNEIDYNIEMKSDIDDYDSELTGDIEHGFTFVHVERSEEPTPVEPVTPVKHEVKISKQDIAGDELPGAQLSVTHTDGEETVTDEKWTSSATPHMISLETGTYTLTEDQAPLGYEIAESIDFTVDEDGGVIVNGTTADEVVMTDEYSSHDVVISKQTVGGEELPGAELTVTDKEGNVVDAWTSSEETHTVSVQPGIYNFHENTAPAGYKKANDVEFEVKIDGTVLVNSQKVNKITMVDEDEEAAIPSTGKLVITKTIKGPVSKEEADGSLKFRVTSNDSGEKVEYTLSSFDYDEDTKTYTKELDLTAGGYTVEEFVTDIDGYTLTSVTHEVGTSKGEGITSYVTVLPEQILKVAYEDAYEVETHDVVISKQDLTTSEEIGGAKLTIADAENHIIDTWVSEEGASHKLKLEKGAYTLTEVTAPDGYEVAERITFEVESDGKITVNGTEIDKVVMYDMPKKPKDDTPETPSKPSVPSKPNDDTSTSPTPSTSPEEPKQPSEKVKDVADTSKSPVIEKPAKSNPNTGDHSNVLVYGIGTLAAVAVVIGIVMRRKK